MSEHFKEAEFRCKCTRCKRLIPAIVDNRLYDLLEHVRSAVGRPMYITSGYRCAPHNAEVGGKPTSDHLNGTAADVVVTSDKDRLSMVKAALEYGCRRVGVYQSFIHLSVNPENPQNVMWLGND